jgi:hypothetical protein
MRRAKYALKIVFVEPRANLGGGIAYSTEFDSHLLNVPAGNMSALPDDPDHFLRWMQTNVAQNFAYPADLSAVSRRLSMFHKGKRRRRFIAFTQAEPGASSSDGLSELARIAASFEPVRYELDDRQLAAFPDRDEPRGLKPAGDEPARERVVSEGSSGEKIFHFGCYPSVTRSYLGRKIATPADSRQQAIHERTER